MESLGTGVRGRYGDKKSRNAWVLALGRFVYFHVGFSVFHIDFYFCSVIKKRA